MQVNRDVQHSVHTCTGVTILSLDDFTLAQIIANVARTNSCARYARIVAPYHLINLRATCRRFRALIDAPPHVGKYWLVVRAIRASDSALLSSIIRGCRFSRNETTQILRYTSANIDQCCTPIICKHFGMPYLALIEPRPSINYDDALICARNQMIQFIEAQDREMHTLSREEIAQRCATIGATSDQVRRCVTHHSQLIWRPELGKFVTNCSNLRAIMARRSDQVSREILEETQQIIASHWHITSLYICHFLNETSVMENLFDFIRVKHLRDLAYWIPFDRGNVISEHAARLLVQRYGFIELIPFANISREDDSSRVRHATPSALFALRNARDFEVFLDHIRDDCSMSGLAMDIHEHRLHIRQPAQWYKILFAKISRISCANIRAMLWWMS